MRKILFLLVFFVSSAWAQIPTDIIEKARDATVLIANTATEGGMGSGVVSVSYTHLTLPTILLV